MRYLLGISLFISVATYLFWPYFPKGTFYIGNALFIFLICLYLFINDKPNHIKFILFGLSVNNLLDELLFDNTVLGWNELVFGIVMCLIVYLRLRYDRQDKRIIRQ